MSIMDLAGASTEIEAPSVNDLAIRVGTVNGSGSQTANLVLLRALHGMGIPCSGKNIFPSNIEGLPTFFHLRASGRGYTGHRADPDVLVCMYEPTAADDVRALPAGGLCLYRDDFKEPIASIRDDVTCHAVPFARLAEQAYPPVENDAAYRDKLRKVVNMVYVGVLAHLVGIEMAAVTDGIRREFPGRKAKAAEGNIRAALAGYDWARENLPVSRFRVERLDKTGGQILIEGNKAAALGLVFGGTTVLSWYPITPSSSLAEYAEGFLKKYRNDPEGNPTYAVVQAEDELAAIGMAVGAGWAGARPSTATSGPGISLMGEFIGLAYFAEIPVTVIDVQRMGPSTGLPTRTSQGDMVQLHTLGHGDGKHPVLIPSTPDECFAMAAQALDLAADLQTPVFVALDLDLGMNLWLSDRFEYPEGPIRRGKVLDADDLERLGRFDRYKDVDGDGVCYRTLPGTAHPLAAYFTRGTGHNESSGYSERPHDWAGNLARLARKFETARKMVPSPIIEDRPGAAIGLIAFGTTHVAAVEARDRLLEAGLPTAYCRLRALPAAEEVAEFVARYDRVYVVEQNRDGQVRGLLASWLPGNLVGRLRSIVHYNGMPIASADIAGPILRAERGGN
ncbi:MAG: 2-oxoacid:acceptor oxidoreductase subunit alpha [Isosphaeraceae bacterium]